MSEGKSRRTLPRVELTSRLRRLWKQVAPNTQLTKKRLSDWLMSDLGYVECHVWDPTVSLDTGQIERILQREIGFAGKTPTCLSCDEPLRGYERGIGGWCRKCWSHTGKLGDLDVAIRASGDGPDRISEWPSIRHLLRERFGQDRSDTDLWERFCGFLQGDWKLSAGDYLKLPLSSISYLLKLDSLDAIELPLEIDECGNIRSPAWVVNAYGLLLDNLILGPTAEHGNRFPISSFDAKTVADAVVLDLDLVGLRDRSRSQVGPLIRSKSKRKCGGGGPKAPKSESELKILGAIGERYVYQ